MLIWFKIVVSTYSTLSLEVALLGATVCADTQDRVSSERHIARRRWGKEVEGIIGFWREEVERMRFRLGEGIQSALFEFE